MLQYGGDYSPEQWLFDKNIIKQDIEKLEAANVNTFRIGMFAWGMLEPVEGQYNIDWIEQVIATLKTKNIGVILGTPTASRPHWMAIDYPQTSRVNASEQRQHGGSRHNHCMSSPIFREKVELLLAQYLPATLKYDNITSIHINNEFGGECYCALCQAKFQHFLKSKYQTIDTLNHKWWNNFWSHQYRDFDQILPPFPHGEKTNTALKNNWREFVTASHIDYYQFEYKLIRKYSNLPITTNFHLSPFGERALNYYQFAKHVDYLSLDLYPEWNTTDNFDVGLNAKLHLLLTSSLDPDKDFHLMETSPGGTNWQEYSLFKSGDLHIASMFLNTQVAAKSYLYFQLKQSLGSSEKFHGSLLNGAGDTTNRVYKYCQEFGSLLKEIEFTKQYKVKKEVGIYFNPDNIVMLNHSEGPRNKGLEIEKFLTRLLEYFNGIGVNVDFFYDHEQMQNYDSVIFPYSYHVNEDVINSLKTNKYQRVIAFPLFSYVDSDDLLYDQIGPYQLTDYFGIKVEEVTAIPDEYPLTSDQYQFETIAERIKILDGQSLDTFNDEILQTAISHNQVDGTNYYYIAAIPKATSLFNIFDRIFKTKHKPTKVISSKLIDDQNNQLIVSINFGDEQELIPNIYKIHFQHKFTDQYLDKYGVLIYQDQD